MAGSKISFYHYNTDDCFFSENITLKECAAYDLTNHVNWINVTGIKDSNELQEAAEIFQIHPLVVEDILHTEQRAKIEDYGDFNFVVLPLFAMVDGKIEEQQVSFVVKNNLLLSFCEIDFGIFKKQVGDKLVLGTGNIRKKGEDFLLYKLLDVSIDNYYFVLEYIEARLETIDGEIMIKPDDRHIVQLQRLRGELLYLRKSFLPARDLIHVLSRNEIDYFDPESKYNLRDLHDHMQRNIEELDFLREQVSSLMDFYYSLQTHKMNNVMRTLTIVSFVFLPLTFIASLYGMNFDIMPHTKDVDGFWKVLGGMGVLALILVSFAFRRQWLSTKDFLKEKL